MASGMNSFPIAILTLLHQENYFRAQPPRIGCIDQSWVVKNLHGDRKFGTEGHVVYIDTDPKSNSLTTTTTHFRAKGGERKPFEKFIQTEPHQLFNLKRKYHSRGSSPKGHLFFTNTIRNLPHGLRRLKHTPDHTTRKQLSHRSRIVPLWMPPPVCPPPQASQVWLLDPMILPTALRTAPVSKQSTKTLYHQNLIIC